MVSGNDPVEPFFNSIKLVKDALLPLESGIRKAAKEIEFCWPGRENGTDNNSLEVFAKQSTCSGAENGSKVQMCSVEKKSYHTVASDEKKKGFGFLTRVSIKAPLGIFSPNCGSNGQKIDTPNRGLKEDVGNADGTCPSCLEFAVSWLLLFNGFVQAFPSPFRASKKRLHAIGEEVKVFSCSCPYMAEQSISCEVKQKESKGQLVATLQTEDLKHKRHNLSIHYFIGFVFDQLAQNLQKFDSGNRESESGNNDPSPSPHSIDQGNHLRILMSVLAGQKADVNEFLVNLRFAKVGGVPSNMVGVTPVKEESDDSVSASEREETGSSPQNLASGLLSIPLSNIERLRSTLSTVSLTELIELVPQLGRSSTEYPDKKKLFSVQDFFRYTESEGRRFFEELDRDGDGQVTMEDLEVAMRKRKLPWRYAREFMHRTRSNLFSKSFGWKQFLSLMEQKEPTILRAYMTLCLSKSGTLQRSEILASLNDAGLPANEDNAVAMMRFLNSDTEESISYGHFRNFMLLLPSDRLQEDPRSIWFEAATVVAVAPPVELPASSVLKSALAGGLSCALSCSLMHPVDTIKVQSVASFCSTFLGTAVRIPCEVLKQRLQAGIFDNVGEAIVCTWNQDGLKGFFRGTGATLFREVPFYVAGMGLYAESKKAAQHLLERDLEPWETIAVGALSGGLAAVVTTPFDVMKTRMMTAPGGRHVSMSFVALSILRHEGALGLFKGAVPRFFWIAPLGAMNFAGYELAKKAMVRKEDQTAD
ncbi:uncharacterized protein LOC127797024 isoform X2 [Diospyros lotus]|uniref:uncharacterized protein LOC127797024 isoform X2 n=1 Tax=Diospyros lotus TaxID=55363 RepID=UPI0022543106|nr:uncharacterized protein LOC127797024 isoform X2 [Diospyros lotus]